MSRTSAREASAAEAAAAYGLSIIRLAFAYVKNLQDAEDIAQEVLLAYLCKAPAFPDRGAEKAWIMRVTVNKSKDFLRSGWRRRRAELTENLSFLPPEEGEALHQLLALEEKYRIPVWLHYFYGYTIREIAGLLGAKPATVGTWLDRGRKILREKLGDDFDAE